MLLSWQALTLGSELSQTTADAETGVTWLDDIIDVTILSCLIWISKLVSILLLLLSQECLNILASFLLSLIGERNLYASQDANSQKIGRFDKLNCYMVGAGVVYRF